ncbi:MAG TPA: tRNA glutamyl-Q(34) synthetase GluQRS [Candidatus Butyricicoccus stercorigallinarum]|nr:tRNA glutamyl-Q(34) synthetase GluQRS [Candidatus Butyricicoccus stercorigallinarum]
MTVGRFAPTPSGRMHLGNVLCAMLSWLSVRARGGRYLLRIEDLDAMRCPRALADQIEDDLRWFGLDWDDGGSDGGAQWYQSTRAPVYDRYFAELTRRGLVYPCFCSRAELHAAQAPHRSDGTYVYAGTCRGLTPEQIAQKRKKRPPAARVCVPDRTVSFVDGCQGAYAENLARDCGDFIIRRSDGVYGYQLAVVVDDAEMGVTEVVRGSDLLESTPRQLYLYETLGLPAPAFYHIPLLTAPDGRRLSKRDGDLDLGALRARFGRPEPVVGMLAAAAGLRPTARPVALRELADDFTWDAVRRADIALPPEILRA